MKIYLAQISWTDVANIIVNILIAASAIFAVIVTNRYWHKQKKSELSYEKMLQSYMAAWKLLAYLSDMDNGKNIVSFFGRKEQKEYFFNVENAKEYIEQLRIVFFDEGNGLFLNTQIKDILFHVRFSLHKDISRLEKNAITVSKHKIEDEGFVKFMKENHDKLSSYLKEVVKFKIDYKE